MRCPGSCQADKHSVFGRVSSGQEVVDAIAQDDVMTRVSIEGDASDLLAAHKGQVDEWNGVLGDLGKSRVE